MEGYNPFQLRQQLRAEKAAREKAEADLAAAQAAAAPKTPEPAKGWWNQSIEPNKPRWTYLAAPLVTLVQATVSLIAAGCVLVPTVLTYLQNEQKNAIERVEKQFTDVQTRLSSPDPKTRAVAMLQLAELAQQSYPQKATFFHVPDSKSLPFSRENYPFFSRAAQQYATTLPMEEETNVRAATKTAIALLCTFAKDKHLKKEDATAPQFSPGTTETMVVLTEMANELSEANRAAKDTFIRALADYSMGASKSAKEKSPLDLDFVASVAPFCEDVQNTKRSLEALMAEGEATDTQGKITTQSKYAVQRKVFEAKQNAADAVEKNTANSLRLPKMETAAKQLIDTRNALVTALSKESLTAPADYPTAAVEAMGKYEAAEQVIRNAGTGVVSKVAWEQSEAASVVQKAAIETIKSVFQDWKRQSPLRLSDCFLAGADLTEAQLQGAFLNRTHFEGVFLNRTQLQGAHFIKAQMQGAYLIGAALQGADMNGARLQKAYLATAQAQGADLSFTLLEGADLSETQLQGADLTDAQMQGAYLIGTELQEADLRYAQLQRASLYKAQVQGTFFYMTQLQGANFYDATVQMTTTTAYKQTNFADSCWSRAVFIAPKPGVQSVEADARMTKLRNWLTQFREMPAEKVITYEAWKAKQEKGN